MTRENTAAVLTGVALVSISLVCVRIACHSWSIAMADTAAICTGVSTVLECIPLAVTIRACVKSLVSKPTREERHP